jgi:hypothetical protein
VPLKECRRTNKLILLYKILHDETPLYLLNEILLQANHQSSYNLRFNRVFEPPFCNTTSYKCSVFPNVIDSWNLLDVDTQHQHSRLMFKKQIRSNISVPPPILPWVQENTTQVLVTLVRWFRVSLWGWCWRQLSLLLCLSTFHLPKNFAVYSTERFSRLPKHWCTVKGITWPFFWC